MESGETCMIELHATDAKLMAAIAKGGQEASKGLAEIERRYAMHIKHFIYGKIKNAEVAETLTQDVIVRIWKYAATYEDRGKFSQWWKSIAQNIIRDWLKFQQQKSQETSMLFSDFVHRVPDTIEIVTPEETDVEQGQSLELLKAALEKTLREAAMPKSVERWKEVSAYSEPQTVIAHKGNVSYKNFWQSLARVEPYATAGTIVNTLLLGEPREAVSALLSTSTLESPIKLRSRCLEDYRVLYDRRLGFPFWNAANMQAFDKICGLDLTNSEEQKGGLPFSVSLDLAESFKELIIRSAEDIRYVLTQPRLHGTVLGARRVIRDGGYMVVAARALRKHGQEAVKESVHLLQKAGVANNIYLQRHNPLIQAYSGIEGNLSEYYNGVLTEDSLRGFDLALFITFLAGPRNDNRFAQALVWGRKGDIEHVLEWAKRMQRFVSHRWVDYNLYGLDNRFLYTYVPDLAKMVASWPVLLASLGWLGPSEQVKIGSKLEEFLDKCKEQSLRRSAEEALKVVRLV